MPVMELGAQIGSIMPGRAYGRYLVVRRLGEGGMARVWLAVDVVNGTPCALKESKRFVDEQTDGASMRSLLDEAALLRALNHPAVPKLCDVISGQQSTVLVMEFFEGVSLATACMGRCVPFEVPWVIDWGIQLCDVLSYLHGQDPPVIYRDLKPGNIVVASSGLVRLVDFGIACRQGEGAAKRVLGTSGYAAPEQLAGGEVDVRADIYALGTTLHRLLTLRTPERSGPPCLMRTCRPEASAQLEEVIARCTQAQPSERYETCRDVAEDLACCPEAHVRMGERGVGGGFDAM